MLFFDLFGPSLLLPLLGPGVALGALLAAGRRRRATPALLLALLLLLPAFGLAQCLLGVAGWCLTPLAAATARPLYAPWYAELLLAPVCYVYLRVLTSRPLRARRAWRQLLPGLGHIGLFAGVAILGLGCRHGVAPHLGPPAPAAVLLRQLLPLLALGCYALLLRYGLRTLEDYHRCQPVRPWGARRTGSQRRLLVLLLLGFGLGTSFVGLEAWFGPFAYSESWYAFGVRAGLVFGLAVVGLQAGCATARPVALASLPAGPVAATTSPAVEPPVPAAPHPAAPPPELPPELLPWRERLLALMADERPYLKPELTLGELAQHLRTHPAQLSRIINLGCGQSFSDFVNGYRVAEAQRKLADPRYAHYSLVGVALESGFNSKSTFNRVFKKVTGQAPGTAARPSA